MAVFEFPNWSTQRQQFSNIYETILNRDKKFSIYPVSPMGTILIFSFVFRSLVLVTPSQALHGLVK